MVGLGWTTLYWNIGQYLKDFRKAGEKEETTARPYGRERE
jgi:hypothetical protein